MTIQTDVADDGDGAGKETCKRNRPHASGPHARRRSVGLCLSGGGYRAAAFGLGVVLWLVDSGKLREVGVVSSVSGGSITSAFLARLGASEAGEVCASHFRPLVVHLSSKDLLTPKRLWVLAIGTPIFIQGALFLAATSPGAWWPFVAAAIICLVISVILWLRLQHGFIRGLQKLHSRTAWLKSESEPPGKRVAVSGLDPFFTPVFCATDLSSGRHFYVSPDFVAVGSLPDAITGPSPPDHVGTPRDLSLAQAVAASAAYPIIYKPVTIKPEDFGLPTEQFPKRLHLADGGLVDNLGFTFFSKWVGGELPASLLRVVGEAPDTVLVVSSGVPHRREIKAWKIWRTIARSMDVIHQSNGLARAEQLESLRNDPDSLDVSVVSVADDPYSRLSASGATSATRRALEFLDDLSCVNPRLTSSWWESSAQQRSRHVPTGLSRLGRDTVTDLVVHGYCAAMATTAAEFGWVAERPGSSLGLLPGMILPKSSRENRIAGPDDGHTATSDPASCPRND